MKECEEDGRENNRRREEAIPDRGPLKEPRERAVVSPVFLLCYPPRSRRHPILRHVDIT